MKQTIEIEVPDGKTAVWKDGRVIFENINPLLPKTWEEFCQQNPIRKMEYFIDENSEVWEATIDGDIRHYENDKNVLPSKQAAEQYLALMQLHQLRDAWREGWLPNLKDDSDKYGIELHYNPILRNIELRVAWYDTASAFLSFPTYELANEFLTNFRDLIEQAGDLI